MAMKRGDSYLVQKLARLIAGRHMGPRKTQYRQVATSTATVADWQERMAKPGINGGCLATVTSTEAMVRTQPRRQPREAAQAWDMAKDDYRQMRRRVWRMSLWRTWPDWSMPAELLRLVLHPEWVNPKRPQPTRGLGANTQISRYGVCTWALLFLLFAYRRSRRLAVQVHKAQACRIPKHNFKLGCDGGRGDHGDVLHR